MRNNGAPAAPARWGKDEQWNELIFTIGGNKGCGACEDAADAIRKVAEE